MELSTDGAPDDLAGSPLAETVSLVSHELRTPLTLIKGYVATLLHLPNLTDEEREHYLRGIEQANTRLTDLVDNILDMTTIDSGRLTLHLSEGYLDALVRRTVRQMQAQTDEHLLRVHSPRPLPPLPFDSGRMEQVLSNLVGNAIKYSPEGGVIDVTLGVAADWSDLGRPWPAEGPATGALAYVRVCDQGSGIAAEDLPHLFTKFHRGSRREHRAMRGVGIGLYICRAIIEAHGGAIWAGNRPEGGSCFTFCLPIPNGARH
jgi:signal transduction histidine kinase